MSSWDDHLELSIDELGGDQLCSDALRTLF